MCGVLAALSFSGALAPDCLQKGLDALRHRGPDDRGIVFTPNRHAALGQARLSIMDGEGGRQPLLHDRLPYALVVNGEFYDFERIRSELQSRGRLFQTRSDSEIALHLYQQHGAGCLKYLRGEFAFILGDGVKEKLFAARDRFGIKPLYYTVHENTLFLASEIKALFAEGAPARWDTNSWLHRRFLMGNDTLFQGIHQVPPGCYMEADENGFRFTRYWDFNYPQTGREKEVDEFQAADELAAIFEEAVRLRMRSDVPVCIYLSGGLDSSAVLAATRRVGGETLPAFTLSFPGTNYDEAEAAGVMAEHAGVHLQRVPVSQDVLASGLKKALYHGENVCFNAHGAAKYILSKAVQKAGYKVALTGEGADEIFGGYGHFRRDQKQYGGKPVPNDFIPSWLKTEIERCRILERIISLDLKPISGVEIVGNYLKAGNHPGQWQNRAPLHRAMYLLSASYLPNYVLATLGDRMEMASSVEGRLPFLDHHLVEFAVQLPADMKIRGDISKYILRRACEKDLPPRILNRSKHAFQAPPTILKRDGPLRQLLLDTLHGTAMNTLPFFDKAGVKNLISRTEEADTGNIRLYEGVLMEILSLAVLQEIFGAS
ncbi:MAG: asparagine synthase (glutamine-hydrolyzing) [Acidobacteriota bacterium]|nr:asparagine synthase (glutamine-hydrolyzing) [Acidobacteriota bacterium]